MTHRNLLDGTAEGVRCSEDRLFSVQYHPESAPGPQESAYLFDEFLQLMEQDLSLIHILSMRWDIPNASARKPWQAERTPLSASVPDRG